MAAQTDKHSNEKADELTDFGYSRVPEAEKARLVREVFDSVADRYDLMNDLMSFGIHRLWKKHLVRSSGVRPGAQVLDLAGGTGDIARLLRKQTGREGSVVLGDINNAMLRRGRARLEDNGVIDGLEYVQCDAEQLPFPDGGFDLITIGFGLRNVTHKETALRSMYRTLKPGGRLLVLEFSKLQIAPLRPLYDLYSFKVLPRLGRAVARDPESYQYLAESIRKQPDQDELKTMFEQAGFERCSYQNLSGGVVAIHSGYRI
ncbi:MAG: bifunctional demethylmenaquinone methyltransferase/2-methoxy-6-polyprenyl-1,4-benzoquinol methylase UbiE [Gammaproteobacteria bacterium]|nr:MAG: bifunctional demethylmenaquinone methyltransferase/2-methoxy-6-polyprenyl-1,4-benzoquinol methylase UbiE [Gammaproteobacteria bacterium]